MKRIDGNPVLDHAVVERLRSPKGQKITVRAARRADWAAQMVLGRDGAEGTALLINLVAGQETYEVPLNGTLHQRPQYVREVIRKDGVVLENEGDRDAVLDHVPVNPAVRQQTAEFTGREVMPEEKASAGSGIRGLVFNTQHLAIYSVEERAWQVQDGKALGHDAAALGRALEVDNENSGKRGDVGHGMDEKQMGDNEPQSTGWRVGGQAGRPKPQCQIPT